MLRDMAARWNVQTERSLAHVVPFPQPPGAQGQDRFFIPAVERPRALWGGSVGVWPEPFPAAGGCSSAGPPCCPRALLSPALEAHGDMPPRVMMVATVAV
jgi:hypothetical protein